MALIGGLSSADAKQISQGSQYWDNELLGFDTITGTYAATPAGDAMYQIEDEKSYPGYKNDL